MARLVTASVTGVMGILRLLRLSSTIDDAYEWDDDKALSNFAKHGITFDMARNAFRDGFLFEWPDIREAYGEDRYQVLGMVERRLVHVSFTFRGERIRIISARLAEPWEKRKYHEKKS